MNLNLFLRRAYLIAILLGVSQLSFAQANKPINLQSPDGKLSVSINIGDTVSWELSHETTRVLLPSAISLTMGDGQILGHDAKVAKLERNTVNTTTVPNLYKKKQITDHYNRLFVRLKGDYGIEFRAYNDAALYRFVTNRKGDQTIRTEQVAFNFEDDKKAFIPYVNDTRGGERYSYSFESFYDVIKLSQMAADSLAITPLLVDLGNKKKAAIMEGDVEDYPGMFLKINPKNPKGLIAEFPGYPAEGKMAGYNGINFIATKRADYIAVTKGSRTFPWRAVIVSSSDTALANNDLAQKMASPSRIEDPSWIKPGKVAWEWWNRTNLTHVDFRVGKNTATYKYFIDFAASNKLEYIVIDGGWSVNTLMKSVDALDIKQLVDYGQQKNVGVILWSNWAMTEKEMETAFPYYSKLGVKGFKVDFIDSDDHKMIKSVYAIAKLAAENKLLLDLHGFKANGIQRTYPNIVNFEGVKGLENYKWAPFVNGKPKDDVPAYDVTIPFIRMLAGPMDYTPGAMENANLSVYRSVNDQPMSQGTRVHQMAMYTIYEAPLQMLSDSPTRYMKEQDCTDFISKVPTVFDETVVLDGQVGEYIVMARKKDDVWHVGAMTNWTAREHTIDFSFLGNGDFEIEYFMDGINADRNGTDYKREVSKISNKDKKNIKMYPGGGWAARIYPSR
ncbi:glycoside hydrolase family 97 protein [Dyadobacter linearis]|nr:glycoside hydrolase family 97 protein [Dyadobacter sp. CECT 9623]